MENLVEERDWRLLAATGRPQFLPAETPLTRLAGLALLLNAQSGSGGVNRGSWPNDLAASHAHMAL
jgi:hypothetical protein